MSTPRDTAPGDRCPICGSESASVFFTAKDIPVSYHVLRDTEAEAVTVPRAPVPLSLCGGCGHVFNASFDPGLLEYSEAYDNSLHFSGRFQEYAEELASGIVARYDLHGKDIIELGCGKGDFLSLLCRLGGNRGVGFDRAYAGHHDAHPGVRFVRDFYSERYAGLHADLLVCRQVLEHIPGPREFLSGVRAALSENPEAGVVFEVPNGAHMLEELKFWDIIYEHCGYFTRSSLERVFQETGFEVERIEESFEGQFLVAYAKPARDAADRNGTNGTDKAGEGRGRGRTTEADRTMETGTRTTGPGGHGPDPGRRNRYDPETLERAAGRFARAFEGITAEWRSTLTDAAARGRRIAVWGAGTKGIGFLNMLGVSSESVRYIVDLNPRKHGKYLTGTGQIIVAPEFMAEYVPDIVIVMNPVYRDEIGGLLSRLGVTCELKDAAPEPSPAGEATAGLGA